MAAMLCGAVLAQEDVPDKLNVTFSDPSRPGQVKVSLVNGGITVKGYDGKEVLIEAKTGGKQSRSQGEPRRIVFNSSGLQVEESGNVMTIGARPNSTTELILQVPRKTSLKLHCVNGGGISVEGVEGEIEAHNTNGSVTLTNVSGSAVAHALNGRLTAVFDRVDPSKPMSFSSLNGKIELTFPASLKANLKIDPGQGEVYSDFEVLLQPRAQANVEDKRSSGGKYTARFGRSIVGTINGGGPEISVRNFNGSVYIKKAGAAQ
jgi:DUF4097 and DUF4098 domain-containing protein YvlB